MLNLLLAHLALGVVLGVGKPATALFIPSLAALIEGALFSSVLGYPFVVGCVIAIAILTCVQVGYVVGSLVRVMGSDVA